MLLNAPTRSLPINHRQRQIWYHVTDASDQRKLQTCQTEEEFDILSVKHQAGRRKLLRSALAHAGAHPPAADCASSELLQLKRRRESFRIMEKREPSVYLTGYSLEPNSVHLREVLLTSIANPVPNRQFAAGRLTLYYGAPTTQLEMGRLQVEATRKKQDLYQISVEVRVQKIVLGLRTFEDLKMSRMLDMQRLSHAVRERVEEYWRSYLREEGKTEEWINDAVRSGCQEKFINDRLDLLPRLAKEPEFNHLALIVYEVVEGSMVYKVGTILDPAAIKWAQCKSHPCLPVTVACMLQ